MLSLLSDVATLLIVLAGTGVLFFWIERRWPAATRMQHNEIIGWQLNILGTIYAIILGFMLYTTWNAFQAAKQNAGAEATSLVDVSRISYGLPQPQNDAIQSLTREYANVIVTQEWPAMQDSRFSPASHVAVQRMWAALTSVQPKSAAEQAALDHALSEMSNLTDHRRIRKIQVFDSLPLILWVVLNSGGALLLICCCLFGSHQVKLHLFLVLSLSFLLTLLLLTIAAIDRPFQGWLSVPVGAFQNAVATLNER